MADEPEKRKVERDIDENLRRVYQRRAQEPLPDRFENLLRELREGDDNGGGDTA